MKNFAFRIFNPDGPKENPVERRRNQLRRAQQNYRDRRDNYTKSLEKELERTRAHEAELMRDAERLRSTVQGLAKLLSDHGIDVPASDPPYEEPEGGLDENSAQRPGEPPISLGTGLLPQAPTTETDVDMSIDPVPAPSAVPSDHYSSGSHQESSSQQQQYDAQRPSRHKDHHKRLGDLDLVTIGMEFVLNLERPCLTHLHGDPSKPNEPTGHALTTSAQILSISSSSSSMSDESSHQIVPLESGLSFQEAPAAMLERLLNLSPILSSDGEITPIQAWNYIRAQPYFTGLKPRLLGKLGERLRSAVKCHGFGAVVETNIFERMIVDVLLSGQSG